MREITKGSLMVTIETLETIREEVLADYDCLDDALPDDEPDKARALRKMSHKASELYKLIYELNKRLND